MNINLRKKNLVDICIKELLAVSKLILILRNFLSNYIKLNAVEEDKLNPLDSRYFFAENRGEIY